LFGRVVQDATVYFLAIVWVHLTVLIYVSRTIGSARILMLFPAITNTFTPVMICRLVLSLRKASDPNLVKAWNVDHFSTQIDPSLSQSGGSGGVHLSPLRFRGLTTTLLVDSEEGTGSDNGLMMASTLGGSVVGSGWTIDGDVPGEDESSRRARGCRIS